LVYYKWFDTIIEAIAEEKRIKAGSRKKKSSSTASIQNGRIYISRQDSGKTKLYQ